MNHSANEDSNSSPLVQSAKHAASRVASTAADLGHDVAEHYVREPAKDLFSLAKDYAKDHPDVAAGWAFVLGVIVGWKLKP